MAFLLTEMVDHALDAMFDENSAHRKVFRLIVIGNARVRNMTTVEATGKWIGSLSEEEVKKITYDDFQKAVGDDGDYYNR